MAGTIEKSKVNSLLRRWDFVFHAISTKDFKDLISGLGEEYQWCEFKADIHYLGKRFSDCIVRIRESSGVCLIFQDRSISTIYPSSAEEGWDGEFPHSVFLPIESYREAWYIYADTVRWS